MATYNCDDVIERAIKSIMTQTYTDYEVVIVDGNSKDDTLKIVTKYAALNKKINYYSSPDNGIYDALNKGVKIARGKYILVMGSDDELINNEILERVADELDNDVDFFSAPVMSVLREYRLMTLFSNRNAVILPHQGVFVKRKILLNRPFDTSLRVSADSDFIIYCLKNDSFHKKFVDYPVMYYSLGGESSLNKDVLVDWKIICGKYNIERSHVPFFKQNNPSIIRRWVKKILQRSGAYRKTMLLTGRWQPYKD